MKLPTGESGTSHRIVDLSAPIVISPEEVPDWQRTDIVYSTHVDGTEEFKQNFGVPKHLLRDEEGPAIEHFTRLMTHNVTHVDAPWHYNSTIQGAPAKTIDQLPLDWFVGPGIVLDMTGRADGESVDVSDLEAGLARISHDLQSGDIVLIRTGCDQFYGEPDYATHGPGVSPEATIWLCDRGIVVMGIDAWGWDAPLVRQAEAALERNEAGVFWAAHQVDREYAQIERMVNLGELPATGFTVVCAPLKIVGGSAGPARALAIVPDRDAAR